MVVGTDVVHNILVNVRRTFQGYFIKENVKKKIKKIGGGGLSS